MGFAGRERRRRFVYVTRNTEYHVMDALCVAVRDRRTRRWISRHVALGQALAGGIRVYPNGAVLPSMQPPAPGAPIYFANHEQDDEQVVTSRLTAIERPAIDDLVRYPAA